MSEEEIAAGKDTIAFGGAHWKLDTECSALPDGLGWRLRLTATVTKGAAEHVAFGLSLAVADWSPDHFLLMPGAVYNGNRYRAVPSREQVNDWSQDMPITITHVPRLQYESGPERSEIQLLTGDLSTPSVAFRNPRAHRALLLQTEQGNSWGDYSLAVAENDNRDSAEIRLLAPGVREEVTYRGRPSLDRGASIKEGQSVTLECTLRVFPCASIQQLYDRFFEVRNEFRGAARWRHDIPFSACWEIQERKYNLMNWVEERGYYSVGMRENQYQDWQTAWTGGFNAVYPLLCEGGDPTNRRAQRAFEFLSRGGLTPSGYFRDAFHRERWLPEARGNVFLRYSGDALYFILRSLLLIRKRPPFQELPQHWLTLAKNCADAFVRTFDKFGRFGQHVDSETGDITIGDTCAASMAPGALALASSILSEARYLKVAESAARYYLEEYIAKGITNGGPGDIIQGIDSESCFGLLESFITLYETTGSAEWLAAAQATAHQCATWVVSYDFRFPPSSTFAKLDMLTTGTVIANIQNKHSAPGICSLSGVSLLKLFRATGDHRYLDLIREIAHAIPQYMSRADRPITDRRPNVTWPVMPPGWINERVNMSDWEVRGRPDEEIGVGEIFGGSTWSEVAMLLTYAELPGIYLQTDTLLLSVFDHVFCEIERATPHELTLRVTNPTPFDGQVKLLVEPSTACMRPLGPLAVSDAPKVRVRAETSVRYALPR